MECINFNICVTCLSSDRRLIPLHEMKNILKEINFAVLETCNNTGICWECKGNILKFHRYKIKALQAQTALSQNLRLKEIKSLSSLVVTKVYQNFYNSDPLVDSDNEPKLENNIIKAEVHDELQSSGTSEKVTETDQIIQIYIETISNKQKLLNNDINKKTNDEIFKEPIEADNLNDKKISEVNIKDAETDDKTDNNCVDLVSPKKRGTVKRAKVEEEIEGKFIRVVFSEEEIIQHRENKRKHYNFKKVPFKCESCVLGFTKKETFDKHMEKKHDKSIGPHKCDICEVRFATKSLVLSHRWRHYSCYRCALCKYDTTELWSAVNHCKIKHKRDQINSIHCSKCETVVKTAEELEEHVQLAHSLHCEECGVRFKGKHTLRNHMARIHASARQYVCDVCSKTFVSRSRLESHVSGHGAPAAARLAYCASCRVQYKNIHVYRNHLKNSAHHSERAFSCPECNKKFASKVYWTKHYNFYHLRKSQYNCEICDKLFISEWRLKNHRQKHHGLSRPRDHPCNICGKKFFSVSILRNHKLIHSEQRSYMCEDCGDTFKQRPALYTHAKLLHADGRRK